MRGMAMRFGVTFLCGTFLASPLGVFAASTVTIDNLSAGGSVLYPVPLLSGQVAAGMTTPIGNQPTNFTSPDTVLAMLNGLSNVITSNDNAGADAGATPVRGSAVRYGATGSGSLSNQRRVTSLGATDAGPFAFTRTVFTPGMLNPGDFSEVESNDKLGRANSIAIPSGTALLVHGTLSTTSDLDYFKTTLNAGDILSAMTIPLSSLPTNFSAADTILTVLNDTGFTQFVSNNDAGSDAVGQASVTPALGSVIRYQAASTGLVHLKVSSFAGGGTGNYALLVSRVEPTFVLSGDFNEDGTVDAADYVVWRKNPGGIYTQNDFNIWRANFGAMTGSGSATGSQSIPEPGSHAIARRDDAYRGVTDVPGEEAL